MTDKQPDIEAELASLQPAPLSPECLRGIDQGLLNAPRPSLRLHPRQFLLIAALAAACIVVVAPLYWSILAPNRPVIVTPSPAPSPNPIEPFATVAVYRQAIARGPDALDALLDHEAAVSLRTQPNNNPLRAGFVPDPIWVN